MAAFNFVVVLVICFTVKDCVACQGADKEQIVRVLLREGQWEALAGWLDVEDGVLEGIWVHCGTRGSVSAACYRRRLVEHYCHKTAKTSRQVANDMAKALEEHMDNKRQAGELRRLVFDGENPPDRADSPPHTSHTPHTSHSGSNTHHTVSTAQPSTEPSASDSSNHDNTDTKPSQGLVLEEFWKPFAVAVVGLCGLAVLGGIIYLMFPTAASPASAASHLEERPLSSAQRKDRGGGRGGREVGNGTNSSRMGRRVEGEHVPKPYKRRNPKIPPPLLGTDDLAEVLNVLADVSKSWKELGLALGLKQPTLEEIAANNQTVSECKMDMLSQWLKWVDNCRPSWESLAGALRNRTVNHAPIAAVIETKYLCQTMDTVLSD